MVLPPSPVDHKGGVARPGLHRCRGTPQSFGRIKCPGVEKNFAFDLSIRILRREVECGMKNRHFIADERRFLDIKIARSLLTQTIGGDPQRCDWATAATAGVFIIPGMKIFIVRPIEPKGHVAVGMFKPKNDGMALKVKTAYAV